MRLPESVGAELSALEARFGAPRVLEAAIPDNFDDPIRKPDRFGEVCMVIRRPSGRLLLSIKTFYPRGAYRLPTGGIHHGEGVYDALVREAYEETGLDLTVERFLARIAYHGPASEAHLFHTFAFLLRERGGTLGAIDQSEQIEDWREADVADLPHVADVLDHLRAPGSIDIGGDWTAWGRFRAVVHREVHAALVSRA